MRVVHCLHRYPPALGGSEAFFARLSRYLAACGDEVRVFTSNALDLEAFWSQKARHLPPGVTEDQGVSVRRFPLSHWPGQRYWLKALSLLPLPRLRCLCLPCNPILPDMWRACGRLEDVDLVHATAFPYTWPIVCALRLARRRRIPFVLTPFLHLGDPRDPQDRTRRAYLSSPMLYLLRRADKIFVQTGVEREALLREEIAPGRLELLGMGVDPAECTGGDGVRGRKRWGIGAGEIVVGHLANQSVEKGTVDLLQGSENLRQAGVTHRLLLAGPQMPNFLRYWDRLPRRDSVTRLGVLTDEEKRDFFAAIDVFALPSRSDSFGIVFLEAWANAVPCVAYRAGGVADVIRDGTDGRLVDCGDVPALAGALRRLVESAEERRALGEAGRNRVHGEFAWGPRLRLVRSAYEELVRQTKQTSRR